MVASDPAVVNENPPFSVIEYGVPPGLRGSIVNVTGLLVPFGVVTVTFLGPRAAVALIVKVVVNVDDAELLALTETGPTVTSWNPKLLPVAATDVWPMTKLVPVNVILTVEPTMPLVGIIDINVGGADPTVKLKRAESLELALFFAVTLQ
jgi:hypothetical protein